MEIKTVKAISMQRIMASMGFHYYRITLYQRTFTCASRKALVIYIYTCAFKKNSKKRMYIIYYYMRFIQKSACIVFNAIHAFKAHVYRVFLHALLEEMRMYMIVASTCALSACIQHMFTCALSQKAHVQVLIKLFEQKIFQII